MTKDQLLARKGDLQQKQEAQVEIQRRSKLETTAATDLINALGGAIQDCDFWLAELEKSEATGVNGV